MTTQDPPKEGLFGRRGTSPLADRIAGQRQSAFSRGLGVLLGPARGDVAPPEEEGERAGVAQGLNRSALLSRLQGTHQPQLNRGFYALLQTAVPTIAVAEATEEVIASEYRVVLVDTDMLFPNPYQPRVAVDEAALDRLTKNIQEQGIIEPLEVMPTPQEHPGGQRSYWVISGERRRLAALRARIQRVPAIVKEVSARAALQMFLSRYVHTYPLSILDRARAFATLTSEMGMTVGEVAERVGVSAEQIELELSFLRMEDPIQESLKQGRLRSAQAEVLLKAPDESSRMTLWQYALHYRPSPERMEEHLEEMLRTGP